jgi:hypothetical protein
MFLVNPMLTEMLMVSEKYHISPLDVEEIDYEEFIEIVNYTANMNEIQQKQMKSKH